MPAVDEAWFAALCRARATGDLNQCLELRIDDAEAHGFNPAPAIDEECAWHERERELPWL